jgi:hypothetical protein
MVHWEKRDCLFCGKHGGKTTKEHIIARVISKASGADHIPTVNLALASPAPLLFSNITLPSCQKCNNDFGQCEPLALNSLNEARTGGLTKGSAAILLDWLDKIRVSLYLYNRTQNWAGDSKFSTITVNSRISTSDQYMSIFRLQKTESTGIGFRGIHEWSFRRLPSSFGFLFRDLAIISWSNAGCMAFYHKLANNDRAYVDTDEVTKYEVTVHPDTWPKELLPFRGFSRNPCLHVFSMNLSSPDMNNHLSDVYGSRLFFSHNEGKIRPFKSCMAAKVPLAISENDTAKAIFVQDVENIGRIAFKQAKVG